MLIGTIEFLVKELLYRLFEYGFKQIYRFNYIKWQENDLNVLD